MISYRPASPALPPEKQKGARYLLPRALAMWMIIVRASPFVNSPKSSSFSPHILQNVMFVILEIISKSSPLILHIPHKELPAFLQERRQLSGQYVNNSSHCLFDIPSPDLRAVFLFILRWLPPGPVFMPGDAPSPAGSGQFAQRKRRKNCINQFIFIYPLNMHGLSA